MQGLEDILRRLADPSQHAQLIEDLAMKGTPPTTPVPRSTGPDLGALLAQGPAQNPGGAPTGPMPAPLPAPGVQWWKPPSDSRPPTDVPVPLPPEILNRLQQESLRQGGPPSRGMNPNLDRQVRDDIQFLSDTEFQAKYGVPKPK